MTDDDTDTAAPPRRNSVVGAELRGFVERIERLEAEKKDLTADIGAVKAEAKARGFAPKMIGNIVKLRKLSPSERAEHDAMMELYLSAMGMAQEPPLFRAVGLMGVDTSAREAVIEALKLLAPDNGEIIVKMGGQPVRIWRDKQGEAHAEAHVEPPPPPPGPAGALPPPRPARKPADVPECSEDEAEDMGRQAARDDKAIIANPFPYDDKRRPRWDLGWRRETGSDGMGEDDDE